MFGFAVADPVERAWSTWTPWDLFDPVKSRFIPAGSESMMPVANGPLMSG